MRNLERRIGDVCRKAARKYLEKKQGPIRVNEGNLENILEKRESLLKMPMKKMK